MNIVKLTQRIIDSVREKLWQIIREFLDESGEVGPMDPGGFADVFRHGVGSHPYQVYEVSFDMFVVSMFWGCSMDSMLFNTVWYVVN